MACLAYANEFGRVMMGIFNRSSKKEDVALRTWANVEYSRDKDYAYYMLSKGKTPNLS